MAPLVELALTRPSCPLRCFFLLSTYHKECVGLARAPAGYFSCPQHKCAKCERNSQEAGGMLFRCVVCPCAYCEDDVPTEYEGRQDQDRCFELEQTGYAQPSSAFFITCSKACTDYYQQYSEGKFDGGGGDIVEPIPVEIVESAHVRREEEEKKRQIAADEALAAVTAAAAASGKKSARKGKKGAGAASEETTDAAVAASSSSGDQADSSEFVFKPPTEMPPHVCACLMPRAKKPKLFCICRTPYDKRRNYVACDSCSQWYHLACVKIAEDADIESLEFTCAACKLKDKQRSAKSSGGYELDSDAEAEESSDDDDSDASGDDQPAKDESDSHADSDAGDNDDERGGKRAKKKKKQQKQKQKAAAKSKGKRKSRRGGRGSADDDDDVADLLGGGASKSRGKKQKIRHPIDGGAYPVVGDAAAAAAPAFSGPTLDQALQQQLQSQFGQLLAQQSANPAVSGGAIGDPAVAAAAAAAGLPSFASMDPATLQAMFAFMQSTFSTGGIVAPDGTVSQAPNVPPLSLPLPLALPPIPMPAQQPQQQQQQQLFQQQQQQLQLMQQQQQNEQAMAALQQQPPQ